MDNKIMEIANIINENNGILYLVGGAVRDKLLNKKNNDYDFVVVNLSSQEFKKLFPMAIPRGKFFEVFDINKNEFAIARKEIKKGKKHTDFEIIANENITIEEDLFRRDFTVNAIAMNVITGKIIDPYNGRNDIKQKILKKVSNHFYEDPLRAYRTARFAAQLNFNVEQDTLNDLKKIRNDMKELSAERVFIELKKALLSEKPSIFFEILKKAEILDVHFKEIYKLIGAKQPEKYHPEGDAFNHTMLVLDMAADLTRNLDDNRKLEVRFSALVHDLGKGLTPKNEYPHHYNHEEKGVIQIKKLAKRLKLPNRLLKCGITASLEHMKGGIFDSMKPSTKVQFIERIHKTILGLDGLQIIVNSDRLSNKEYSKEKIYSKTDFEIIGNKIINEITGNYIKEKYKIEDGIKIKEQLHAERVRFYKKIVAEK